MRITSGRLRNRRLNVPNQAVRPTMEAVREAVFSSLGGRCDGLRVLDLFAGSGALGLEAWSRGAAAVTLVEQHPAVCRNLQQNIDALQDPELGTIRAVKADVFRWLERAHDTFDLIFADPPYDLPDAPRRTLDGIACHSLLTARGIVVYEMRSKHAVEWPACWTVLRERHYGKTRIIMLQLKREEPS